MLDVDDAIVLVVSVSLLLLLLLLLLLVDELGRREGMANVLRDAPLGV